MTQWEVEADSFIACNCAYGCPCQFNALPTHGVCESIGAFQFHKGHFGDVSLDGLRAVGVIAWPGPIHEGRGRCLWIIDERASESQHDALLTIVNGGETDPGATMWNVFASTVEKVIDPAIKPIELDIDVDARKGRVLVNKLVGASGTPIRNPVTGDEHRVRIDLPNGFECDTLEVASATFQTSGPIALSHQDCHGHFARLHLNNHGVVRPG